MHSSRAMAFGLASVLILFGAYTTGCGSDSTASDSGLGSNSTTSSGAGGAGDQGGAGAGGAGGSIGPNSPCDPSVSACPCHLHNDCGSGTACVGGHCIAPCDFSYQCGADGVCVNGQCAGKCDAQFPCPESGYKCSKGVCIPDSQNPQCSDTMPCTGGEVCVAGICSTPCSTNAQCAAGEICDWSLGACIDNPSAQPVCMMDPDCSGALAQVCGGDGFCHFVCDPASANMGVPQCKAIDSRFVKCDAGVCKTQEEVSPECTTMKPCALGKDCISNKCL